MATPTIPTSEFKQVFEPGDVDAAFKAAGDNGREAKMFMVPLENVHPIADFNIRIHDADYEKHVESIKESIKQNGFYRHRPLKVFTASENGQDLFYLADGYTRYEGAKRAAAEGAKVTRVPVVAVPKNTSMDDLLIGLDTDNDSRPLSTYEKAILVKRLQNTGNDDDEIATKMRITKQYVTDLTNLMSVPKKVHNMIVNDEVAPNLVMELLKEHGSGKKVLEALTTAGATGEKKPKANGAAGEPTTRVTRKQVAQTGGTKKAGKRLYEALIEYVIVLNSSSGAQSAMDWLIRFHEGDAGAIKELQATLKKGKGKAKDKKEPNPKDVRQKITDDMTDEQKLAVRAHNKEVKARKVRREKRLAARAAEAAKAAKAAGGTPASDEV